VSTHLQLINIIIIIRKEKEVVKMLGIKWVISDVKTNKTLTIYYETKKNNKKYKRNEWKYIEK
jgi:hypothetical protein